MKVRIRIVIVNWNSGNLLKICLASIVNADKSGFELESVVVVDNASNDSSLERIQNINLPLYIIQNKENIGFAAACNQGACGFEGDYLLFLNPDTRLDDQSLAVPVAYMCDNSNVGICGIQLINNSGKIAKSCARFPTVLNFLAHSVGVDKIFPRIGFFMSDWDHSYTKSVDHVIGAFFLVRRDLYDRLNGFDDSFFVYFEDLDFSLRAHREGYVTIYLADIKAIHLGGGTSSQIPALRLFYSMRSRLIYAFKHFNLSSAVAVLLAIAFMEPISRCIFSICRLSRSSFSDTWRACAMFWRWLPKWFFNHIYL